MASIARRTALRALRPAVSPLRLYSTPSTTPEPSTSSPKAKEETPKFSPNPIFPAPINPYKEPEPSKPAAYSETQIKVVRGLARLMGYNSRTTTAIRETRRMMTGIVAAIERDREFWYEECRLPPTYQTFFQLHLLYVLILIPRLRALPASTPTHSHPIPEGSTPSEPQHTPPSTSTSGVPLLGKPHYDSYPAEIINHFFELAEMQMRRILGKGERERVVKNYMAEMGEQWHGAGIGLSYALGLQISEDQADVDRADAELASWLWRNLFGARGLGAPAPGLVDPDMPDDFGVKELEMPEQLEQVARFLRREMARLDKVSHRDVLDGNIGDWGLVSDA